MKLRRALHLVGAGALTGALLLGSAPTASADDIRDRQWALDAFAAKDIWKYATGKGITVAVVDSGVDPSVPDLYGQVLKGKDFTSKGGGDGRTDSDGHGTEVASLIAAHGHGPGNDQGMVGLAPGAKILPIRVLVGAVGKRLEAAKGIKYAVDHGADVINISQVATYSTDNAEAIKYAIEHNVVVVAGSGNTGNKQTNYPAAYPGVVAVGGVGRNGVLWDRSSWGSNVSLIAPAEECVVAKSTSPSGYALADGTSLATAFVSATAALVREEHPDLTAGQVINRMVKTALVPQGAPKDAKLPDPKFGYGVVRPFRAVTYDIPAGPKAGPLAQSSEGKSSESAKASPPADHQSAQEDQPSSSHILLYVLIGLGVLVVLVIVVVLIAKKNRGGGNGPQGPGGGVPPMPHQGGQPLYQAPPGQPHYQAPPGQFGPPPPPTR